MTVWLGYLTLCLVWGTTYLALKVALEGFSPYYMAGWRFLAAGLLLSPVLLRKQTRLPGSRRETIAIMLSGALMLVGANGLVTWSEVYLDSGLTALTVATNPAWAALIGGWFFAHDERMNRWAIAGTVVSMTGVVVLHHHRLRFDNAELPGVIMACAAPLFWSTGSLIARTRVKQADVLTATVIQMLTAVPLFFLMSLLIGESWDVQWTGRVMWSMIYLIAIGSSVVYAVYVWLLKRMPASKLTTYTYVNPIIALIAGYFILGEPITREIVPATVLIIGGLLLVYVTQKKK